MTMREYPQLGEKVFWRRLPNGLPVAVIPRPGFTRKIAYFVTDFGSIHRCFTMDGTSYEAPMGVAHYLEHKLFDMPGRDISGELAALGAMVNAFTSYDMTAYYFSCTEHFPACLRLLLEFVSTPYFTRESVRKEQGIIGQEIDMNADAPETRIFENLMRAMYGSHPIREPILGTRPSIGEITPQILNICHRAFYRPDNMLLCVMGDVDPEQVQAIAQEATAHMPCPRVERQDRWDEPMRPLESIVREPMEVAMPMFQVGFKCEPLEKGEEAVRKEMVADLAAEALFGESSPLYLRLYQEGLIDSSFGGGFETVEGMSMLTASGDSDDPEAVRDAILQQAQILLREGLPEETLLRMKRSAMGRRIRGLDSFDSTCFRLCAYHFSGFDYFRFPSVYQAVTAREILAFIRQTVTEERCCLSIIDTKEDAT